MPRTKSEQDAPADDFGEKTSELDFDVWGGGQEDEDEVQRRRDPLRKPGGRRPDQEDVIDI